MPSIKIHPLIIADPNICHGKPVFKGTRVMVWQVLELLENGASKQDIYKAYPALPRGATEAALQYATQKAKGVSFIPFGKPEHATQVSS